jgi:hypothetical protein
MLKRLIFALLTVPLAVRGQATSDCGALNGECNSCVCCCGTSAIFNQVPKDDCTCAWNVSGGLSGVLAWLQQAVRGAGVVALFWLMHRCPTSRLKRKVKLGCTGCIFLIVVSLAPAMMLCFLLRSQPGAFRLRTELKN